MAKQVGPVLFTGTIDGLIFYKLGDKYYTRSKGSYKSAKHMRRNPRYQRTLEKADQFGKASRLVKEIYYWQIPKAVRKHGLFGKLTGMANRLLQQGKNREEIREQLLAYCQTLQPAAPTSIAVLSQTTQPVATTEATLPASLAIPQPATVTPSICRAKQARYLSKWKVKPCGQLHLPKPAAVSAPKLE